MTPPASSRTMKLFNSPFVKLLITQTQVAFNDNATKLLLIGLVNIVLPATVALHYVSAISLLLVAPYVLFSPLAGYLNDRFAKRDVIRWSLWVQITVMVLLVVAALMHNLPLIMVGFFLLATQAALYTPAKRSIIKEIQAPEKIQEAVGWTEMTGIGAILGGSLAGGILIDTFSGKFPNPPWGAAAVILTGFLVVCILSALLFRRFPQGSSNPSLPFKVQILFGQIDTFQVLWRTEGIFKPALTEGVFYLIAGALLIILNQLARIAHPDGLGSGSATGIFMAVLGVGTGIGSMISGSMKRQSIRLAVVPFAALGMALALLFLGLARSLSSQYIAILIAGIFGGIYCVPVSSALIERSPEISRGRILAGSSLFSSLTGVVAIGLQWILGQYLGLSPFAQLVALALILVITAIISCHILRVEVLSIITLAIGRIFYRVSTLHPERLPKQGATGGALLVANHVSYVDAIIISIASPRPIRFLAFSAFFKHPLLGPILRAFGAIPVDEKKAKDGIRAAAEAIRSGELVCIFPEGQLTRTGALMGLRHGYELIARRAGCPIIPVITDGLWASIFSYEREAYFFKRPKKLRVPVRVAFGEPHEELPGSELRKEFSHLSAEAFATRPEFKKSLQEAFFHQLSHHPGKVYLADYAMEGRKLKGFELLGASIVMGGHLRRKTEGESRIGVVLPPGIAGAIVNLGILFAGKTPVNLNPTAGAAAASHCLSSAGVTTLLTVPAYQKKFASFPWPEKTLDASREIAGLSKAGIAASGLLSAIAPWLGFLLIEKPATSSFLLFTSGSSGMPKGVELTHRNILANVTQINETGLLKEHDVVLSSLPLFHCFGMILGFALPLLTGRKVATAASPFEYDAIGRAAQNESVTILAATPTFIKGYLRKISKEKFHALRFVIAGAERLPESLYAACQEKYGVPILEGYGLTETSPVVSLNQLDVTEKRLGADTEQKGSELGTVGRMVAGISYKILDPATNTPIPGSKGVLAVKGLSIITQYAVGENADKFHEGWFITGDVVSINEEGMLKIEGRTNRFSKIGGEMVPHGAIEEAISRDDTSDHRDCVMGVGSETGEESLVLLTTRPVTREELRAKLQTAGLPNLWIPKEIITVESLPILASGKLDMVACKKLVEQK
jgi:acyl-[acyl-carrier-protein]-phospholipid O-acyltransferase/long-chain-fatty-acid--[acyl-carrier-protein] ligase